MYYITYCTRKLRILVTFVEILSFKILLWLLMEWFKTGLFRLV